jgi:uncharacterized membrane protein YdjX (TVP38/TMEM64 family)
MVTTAILDPRVAYFGALLATIGSAIGCMFLYYLGRTGGHMYLDKVTAKGRAFRLRAWFQTYGLITVYIPAAVPIPGLPLKVFVLCAGALGVTPLRFLMVILIARIPRYFGLAWLGSRYGNQTMPWITSHVGYLALFGLIVAAIVTIAMKWNARRLAQAG